MTSSSGTLGTPFLTLSARPEELPQPIRLRIALDVLEHLSDAGASVRRSIGGGWTLAHVEILRTGGARLVDAGGREGVGELLWELVAGRLAEGQFPSLRDVVDELPTDVAEVCERALQWDSRFDSATELYEAFELAVTPYVGTRQEVRRSLGLEDPLAGSPLAPDADPAPDAATTQPAPAPIAAAATPLQTPELPPEPGPEPMPSAASPMPTPALIPEPTLALSPPAAPLMWTPKPTPTLIPGAAVPVWTAKRTPEPSPALASPMPTPERSAAAVTPPASFTSPEAPAPSAVDEEHKPPRALSSQPQSFLRQPPPPPARRVVAPKPKLPRSVEAVRDASPEAGAPTSAAAMPPDAPAPPAKAPEPLAPTGEPLPGPVPVANGEPLPEPVPVANDAPLPEPVPVANGAPLKEPVQAASGGASTDGASGPADLRPPAPPIAPGRRSPPVPPKKVPRSDTAPLTQGEEADAARQQLPTLLDSPSAREAARAFTARGTQILQRPPFAPQVVAPKERTGRSQRPEAIMADEPTPRSSEPEGLRHHIVTKVVLGSVLLLVLVALITWLTR